MKFLNSLFDFFTSLKLTVACLVCALVLVFVGTLAQVEIGLWEAQAVYFRSLIVFWSPGEGGLRIPVLPGGYLLGGVLFVNLVASHIRRFKYSWSKSGIFLTHAGLIVLLLGQFTTELFQVESFMAIFEGETKNYSESHRKTELVFIDTSPSDSDKVVAVPTTLLDSGETLRDDALPYDLKIIEFFPNSDLDDRAPVADADEKNLMGRARAYSAVGMATVNTEKARNLPTAIVEIMGKDGQSKGKWLASSWFMRPEKLELDGKTYELGIRLKRYYYPFSFLLHDATHDKYLGTEIAKNFASSIHLTNDSTNEDREVHISMNKPLRYAGLAFYQHQMLAGENAALEGVAESSTLQIVSNPSWLIPYISCSLIMIGLLVQFLIHLVKFLKRRRS